MEGRHLYHIQYLQMLPAFLVVHFQQLLYIHYRPSDVYLVFRYIPQPIGHPQG